MGKVYEMEGMRGREMAGGSREDFGGGRGRRRMDENYRRNE